MGEELINKVYMHTAHVMLNVWWLYTNVHTLPLCIQSSFFGTCLKWYRAVFCCNVQSVTQLNPALLYYCL